MSLGLSSLVYKMQRGAHVVVRARESPVVPGRIIHSFLRLPRNTPPHERARSGYLC